jgi:hypothetical protein
MMLLPTLFSPPCFRELPRCRRSCCRYRSFFFSWVRNDLKSKRFIRIVFLLEFPARKYFQIRLRSTKFQVCSQKYCRIRPSPVCPCHSQGLTPVKNLNYHHTKLLLAQKRWNLTAWQHCLVTVLVFYESSFPFFLRESSCLVLPSFSVSPPLLLVSPFSSSFLSAWTRVSPRLIKRLSFR